MGHGVAGWEGRVSSQADSHSDSEERRRGRRKVFFCIQVKALLCVNDISHLCNQKTGINIDQLH